MLKVDKLVKTCEMGVYFQTDKSKVYFLSWKDMGMAIAVQEIRSKFEKNWPELWTRIKESIPEGPIPFIDTPRTREGKLIEDPADLYFLTKVDLLRIGNIQDAMANKLLLSIGKSKEPPLNKLVFALGILHVGRETSRWLADKFGHIDYIGRATLPELLGIPRLGGEIAFSVLRWFHTEGNWKTIEKLRLGGVQLGFEPTISNPAEYYQATKDWISDNDDQLSALRFDTFQTYLGLMQRESPIPSAEKVPVAASPISGKTFMFTGRLDSMTRHQAQSKVEALGGTAGSSVSKNTDYLVVGESPGSKLGHAAALGIKRITEEEFLTMLK